MKKRVSTTLLLIATVGISSQSSAFIDPEEWKMDNWGKWDEWDGPPDMRDWRRDQWGDLDQWGVFPNSDQRLPWERSGGWGEMPWKRDGMPWNSGGNNWGGSPWGRGGRNWGGAPWGGNRGNTPWGSGFGNWGNMPWGGNRGGWGQQAPWGGNPGYGNNRWNSWGAPPQQQQWGGPQQGYAPQFDGPRYPSRSRMERAGGGQATEKEAGNPANQ